MPLINPKIDDPIDTISLVVLRKQLKYERKHAISAC